MAVAFGEGNWVQGRKGAVRFTIHFIPFCTFGRLYHLHVLIIHKIKPKNKDKYVKQN